MGTHAAPTTRQTRAAEKLAADPNRFADALQRLWRTFQQNILYDAIYLCSGTVLELADKLPVSSDLFWKGAALALGKSLVISGVAYVHRLRKPPAAP